MAKAKAPAKDAEKERLNDLPKDKPAAGDKKAAPAKKAMTKAAFLAEIGTQTELPKAKVVEVFRAMEGIIVKQLGAKGPGVIALPGLFKLKAKRVKAVKGGKQVPNRFKPGEMTVTKDKPAHTKVTARPLKALKELLK